MPGAATTGSSERSRVSPLAWLAAHPVEIAFAVVVLGAAAYMLDKTGSVYFWADEWLYADRARQERKLLEPYNDHLSITTLVLYRVLMELFGFSTYVPYQVVGVAMVLAMPVGMFLLFRARAGASLAALAGLALLWHPKVEPLAVLMNHVMVLIGAIACAWGLVRRGRRADAWVAGGLLFAVASAGSGLAVVAAAAVHTLLTGGGRRRWLAVVVPPVLWFAWWLIYLRTLGMNRNEEASADAGDTLRLTWDGIRATFDNLVLGNRLAGALLAVAFVAHLVWRLRQGRSRSESPPDETLGPSGSPLRADDAGGQCTRVDGGAGDRLVRAGSRP